MGNSRREFLKKTGCTLLGLGAGFPLLRAIASEAGHGQAVAGLKQWGLVIDLKQCLRDEVRHACSAACHREHNVPDIADTDDEIKWLWTENYENAFPEKAHPYTAAIFKEKPVLVLCNHCAEPPCVRVCPTQATWKRKSDGIVMMDMHRCYGCRFCMAACPYGARSFNYRDPRPHIPEDYDSPFPTRSMGVVEKCNFCAERLREGLAPACVLAAREVPEAEEALVFGDLTDPHSEVSRLLHEKHTMVRKVSAGTGPNVFYIV